MARALVAIGVSKAGNLPELPGAISDAKRVVNWANSQGFEYISELTDEDDSPVTIEQVYTKIEQFVAEGDVDRLIVYFAGHGFAPVPMHEIWLLSNYDENGNEAINATASVTYARGYRSPKVSFIADACRSTWSMKAPPVGGVIFPTPGGGQNLPQVDEFYPVPFGFTAQEVTANDALKSFGVFSNVVLKGLNGEAGIPSNSDSQKTVVTSQSLKTYVDSTLPNETAEMPGVATQFPQSNANWKEPDEYATFDSPPRRLRGKANELVVGQTPKVRKALSNRQASIVVDQNRFFQAASRDAFETRTGASFHGATPVSVLKRTDVDIFQENEIWHVRALGQKPEVLLVEMERADWDEPWFISIGIFPGLIGSAVIDQDGCWSLNYAPSAHENYQPELNDQIKQSVAEASAYLRNGVIPTLDATDLFSIMRQGKNGNPALSILAANVLHRTGDQRLISAMLDFPIGGGAYTPFDLWALNNHEIGGGRSRVGSFPLMSSTWAALAPQDERYDPRLFEAFPHLKNSLWTMSDSKGAEILSNILTDDEGVTL